MVQTAQRRILLPKTLDDRLITLAGLSQETMGALFYVASPTDHVLELRVDGLFMLGRGGRYAVRTEDARRRIMERFLEGNPEYGLIWWHTHPGGSTNIGGKDLSQFRRGIARNPDHLEMIVTQQKKIIVAYGHGTRDTSLAVVPDPADFAQRNAYVSSRINDATRSLGYERLPPLQATRAHQA